MLGPRIDAGSHMSLSCRQNDHASLWVDTNAVKVLAGQIGKTASGDLPESYWDLFWTSNNEKKKKKKNPKGCDSIDFPTEL